MESGSNTTKRKNCYEEEEEEEEEAKMEKFFALVKSIRESRERLMNLGSGAYGEITEKENKKIKGKEENRVRVWKPEFQLEDFVEKEAHDGSQKYPPLNLAQAGASQQAGDSQKKLGAAAEDKEGDKGMDLTLSL